MKTIIVTGGAGFIGSNFIRHFIGVNPDTRVICLDKLTYAGDPQSLDWLTGTARYFLEIGDIGDRQSVKRLLDKYRPNAILNFAAETHVDRSILEPGAFIQTNIVGTFNLLDEIKGFWLTLDAAERSEFRFVHISTDEVYGSLQWEEPAFNELSRYAPNSPYAASKAASDHLVRAYFHTYQLPCITTNCSNNYGPRQFPEKLIPLMIRNAMNGKQLPIYGDGKNVRDWLFVTDHCAAISRVLFRGMPGQIYNIGGSSEKSNLEVVEQICSILDEVLPLSRHVPHRNLIKFVTDRPGHDRRYAIDCSKIRIELGWKPAENFETGLRKTISWYLENQAWIERIENGLYREWIQANYGSRITP